MKLYLVSRKKYGYKINVIYPLKWMFWISLPIVWYILIRLGK